MDLGLDGRTAIITGGSKGIGFGVAVSLANEGCKVHIASRDKGMLETAAANIKQQTGRDATIHAIDLSKQGSADELLSAVGTPGTVPDAWLSSIKRSETPISSPRSSRPRE
mgnify:CR=1 FL=1